MINKILVSFIITIFFFASASTVSAVIQAGRSCGPSSANPNERCVDGYTCQKEDPRIETYSCIQSGIGEIFGTVSPPPSLQKFIDGDKTGATGISKFLSNLVVLIYIFAAIALLFMLLWGAFDWIISEGDKEKLAGAQRKIINAIIGLMLFAVAFAILKVLGTFTGFEFFKG